MFASRAALETALNQIAFEAGESISATATSPRTLRRDGCGCALGHHLHVRSDGSLFSCFKMEEKVGELKEDSFREVAKRIKATPHPAHELAACRSCSLASLCGAGCRSDNLLFNDDPDQPVCGPWRVRVISELLAEDRVSALEWPVEHLLAEAHARGIDAPDEIRRVRRSRHLLEVL